MIAPRADQAISPSMLRMYENMGWWAQLKMNGTYSVITVRDGEVVDTRNRHDEPHRAWKLTDASASVWRHVPKGEWVFCAELMHSKVPGIRDTHYIHDVVKRAGESLVGSTYLARLQLLDEMFRDHFEAETFHYWVLDSHTWLAKCHRSGFAQIFKGLTRPEEEGLVLKNPEGRLHVSNNNGWTVKCRRPHKNASF